MVFERKVNNSHFQLKFFWYEIISIYSKLSLKPLSVPVILVKLTEDDQIRKDVPYFDEMIVLGTDKPIY